MTLTLLLALLIGVYLLDTVADLLNLRNLSRSSSVPAEFQPFYPEEKYRQSQLYLRETTRLSLLQSTFFLFVTIAFIVLGGYDQVDRLARKWVEHPVWTGLAFVAILSLLKGVLQLPFSLYGTFVIEEKYGFNRTTPRTFVSDLIKSIILGAILGGFVLAGLILFFEKLGPDGWLWAWGALMIFQLLVMFVAPATILPLFFKFTPLPDGELKSKVESYARAQNFQLKGIFVSDASRRSTKTNAFFTGFGRFRRLVLFDTLISQHQPEELVAVVAHEVGHFKRKHIQQQMILSFLTTGLLFFALSRLINHPAIFEAFRMERTSVYASIVFISLFFSPVMKILSIATHWLSRRFEFEADTYSLETYHQPEALITALKRLSAVNLANLFPHPFKVWLDYTHPPTEQRIAAIRSRHSRT